MEESVIPLEELTKGQIAYIVNIDGNKNLLRRLISLNISTDTQVQFLRKAPLGDPLEFLINENMVSLRRDVAQKIYVRICN